MTLTHRESITEALRPFLETNHDLVTSTIEQILAGHPMGMLAMVTGRPYAATWTHRGVGVLPIYGADAGRRAADEADAIAALGAPAVVDLSTLAIAPPLGPWTTLRIQFPQLLLVGEARRDLAIAASNLDTPSSGTLGWDPTNQRPVLTDADPAAVGLLKARTKSMTDALVHVTVTDWTSFGSLPDHEGVSERTMAWLGALDMAKTKGVALWCDDLGLRNLARHEGVATFGTIDLLNILAINGTISAVQFQAATRQLREDYAVDLPLDPEWMLRSAASGGYHVGPVGSAYMRPATWLEPETASRLLDDIITGAVLHDPDTVPNWVYVGATGIMRAINAPHSGILAAGIAARAILAARVQPAVVGQVLAAVRVAAAHRELPSPVPIALAIVQASLSQVLGNEHASTLLVATANSLEDPDRADLHQLLFRISPTNPEEPTGA